MFPAEKLIGKYVYVRRTKPEAGLLNGGCVLRVDDIGRLVIDSRLGVLCLPMSRVTENISQA